MDKNIFYFEKLAVWQKARMLSTKIYEITSHFPSQEKFALTDQLRRAAISVASNIVESAGRTEQKDRLQK
ncbi:MAG: four helix bundle protein [Bacteroidales bacterium]|nr:four helix bundle protein [Bacteroidales bacterium]